MFLRERTIGIDELSFERLKDFGGAEKHAYRVTTRYGDVCAKVFRHQNNVTKERQNRQEMALREMHACRRFKNSPIGIYVPEPLGLITENGQPVGLVMEWWEGEHIDMIWQRRPLSTNRVMELRDRLLSLPEQYGFIPHEDCWSEGNLMVGPEGNMWLAESEISSEWGWFGGFSREQIREYIERVDKDVSWWLTLVND